MFPIKVATMLNAKREASGLTQTALARKAQVSQAYVASIEARFKRNWGR